MLFPLSSHLWSLTVFVFQLFFFKSGYDDATRKIRATKLELLQWACHQSGVPQCTRYDDLKDGFVLLCLAEKLWPGLIDSNIIRNQRRGQRTSRMNWELLRSVMSSVGLPAHLCDPKGVAAGHQRPCYNLLVMFYFLTKLAGSSEFSVDFAHPIDESLAAFLQSPESIHALSKGQTRAAEEQSGAMPKSRVPPITRSVEAQLQFSEDVSGERSLSPAHPAPSPHRRAPVATPKAPMYRSHVDVEADEGTAVATPRRSANAATFAQRELQHCRRAKELLEQELSHVRAMSRHALDQQRTLVEAEMARTHAQFASQSITTRMEAEFAAQKAASSVRAELDRVLEDIQLERQSFHGLHGTDRLEQEVVTLRQSNAVLMGKLQAMDSAVERSAREASQWKESLDGAKSQFDRVLAALQASAALCKESIEIDGDSLPMVLVDRLQSAERAAVLHILRQQQSEKKELRLRVERLEEQAKERNVRDQSIALAGGSSSLTPATSTSDTLQLQRLQRANAMLHEQLGLLKRNGATSDGSMMNIREMAQVLQTPDMRADHLADNTGVVPSSTLGPSATSVDALCSTLWDRLKSLGNEGSADTIQSIFWALTATSQVLNARLRHCGQTAHDLAEALTALQRDRIIERHRSAKELRDKTELLKAQLLQQTTSMRQAQGDVELELKLSRDELQQLRKDIPSSFDRFKKVLTDLFSEFEQQLDGPREQCKLLTKHNTQLRSREQQWRQVAEMLLDSVRRGQGHVATTQAQELIDRLVKDQQLAGREVPMLSDSTDSVRFALGQIRDSVDDAVRVIFGRLEQSQYIAEELRRVSHELASSRAEGELQRTMCDAAKRESEMLRADLDTSRESGARLQASEEVLRQRLAAQVREEQRNMEITLSRILEGSEAKSERQPPLLHIPPASFDRPSQPLHRALDEPRGRAEPPLHSVREWVSHVGTLVGEPHLASTSLQQLATTNEYERAVITPGALSESSAQMATQRTPSVLTPDELERRKQEILSKYGVRSSRSSTA
ncbi:Hypothetical protein, putative [Bodo saltans]|uniref:Calponin-homology (CH) domain-containing protein n=1 Tax=Bodo saltans TaxID=75058 RepID=A0A0S4JIU9_BODSA|nr:Hypothetical protein, putative [Bodo saltans]|eukprot:CUG89995.1 Hypothetical protein, putative [Bodo saltans]